MTETIDDIDIPNYISVEVEASFARRPLTPEGSWQLRARCHDWGARGMARAPGGLGLGLGLGLVWASEVREEANNERKELGRSNASKQLGSVR